MITITYCEGEEDTCANKLEHQCTSENGCRWTKKDAYCENRCSELKAGSCVSPCQWLGRTIPICGKDFYFSSPCSDLKSKDECDTQNVVCEWDESNSKCQAFVCNTKNEEYCNGICSWNPSGNEGNGACVNLDCSTKDNRENCNAVPICMWTSSTENYCGYKGEDPCINKEQNECIDGCRFIDETWECAKISDTGDSGSETSEDSEGESEDSGSKDSEGESEDSGIKDSEGENDDSGSRISGGSVSDSNGFLKLSIFICLFVFFL